MHTLSNDIPQAQVLPVFWAKNSPEQLCWILLQPFSLPSSEGGKTQEAIGWGGGACVVCSQIPVRSDSAGSDTSAS